MQTLNDEKRRYFRIEDTIGVDVTPLSDKEASLKEAEMRRPGYHSPNRIQIVERELQLLIDKMRIQNPEFAKAVELLNTKFSILKESYVSGSGGMESHISKVSLSACGVSFNYKKPMDVGEKMEIDLTLLPTDLHIITLGEVIGCDQSEEELNVWVLRVDFYATSVNDEELLVQHIVKRQGQLLASRRRDNEYR